MTNIKAVIFDFWEVLYNPTTHQLNAGATEVLQRLADQKLPCAIASSSSEVVIKTFLEQHNLTAYFPVIIGQEAVLQQKPNPACYLLAAERLHCTPAQCLVVDDTASCIEAAQQAGFPTLLYGQNGNEFDTILSHV